MTVVSASRPAGYPLIGAAAGPDGAPPAPEFLDPGECRRLLGSGGSGHLGYSDGALPALVPAPFAVHDDAVVVPVPVRSPVAWAVRGAVVAFGVDAYRAEDGTGWGVTVVGPARVVVDHRESAALDALGLFPVRRLAGHCYVRVRMGMVHGWRWPAVEGAAHG